MGMEIGVITTEAGRKLGEPNSPGGEGTGL